MQTIVVLGGGISGLSLLWYLKKKHGAHASLKLIEKNSRVGGWIQSVQKEGFLFERGPRSCRVRGHGSATLELIEELGIQDQVIAASPSACQRYLYLNQRLQKIPSHPLSFLFSPLTRAILPKILLEWKISPGTDEDESIHHFFARRFGLEIVDNFIDPLTSGIYAGDAHNLSMRSCFPHLFQWEREYGSILKGAIFKFFSKKDKATSPFIKKMKKAHLFSFKNGMETLPKELAKRLENHILTDHEVIGMQFNTDFIELRLKNGSTFKAEQVYSTLPAQALSSLIRPHNCEVANLLNTMTATSVASVSLGYKRKLMTPEGFGYLVPSKEKENILGVVWDSCVFPQQGSQSDGTRLTVMIGGVRMPHFSQWNEKDFLNCALKALAKHLQIHMQPDVVDVFMAHAAIPQYEVGHEQKKTRIHAALKELSPRLKVLGSSFDGVAVNDCIANVFHCNFVNKIENN